MKFLNYLFKPFLTVLQVRQHLSRLPTIDPNTRTLLITGRTTDHHHLEP